MDFLNDRIKPIHEPYGGDTGDGTCDCAHVCGVVPFAAV